MARTRWGADTPEERPGGSAADRRPRGVELRALRLGEGDGRGHRASRARSSRSTPIRSGRSPGRSRAAESSSGEWFPSRPLLEWLLPRRGIRVEEVSEAMAFTSPLKDAPLVPKDRGFIIGGLGDRLAPPSQSVALWEHWDKGTDKGRFPGNHVLHVNRAAYLAEMGRFLYETGFSEGLPARAAA